MYILCLLNYPLTDSNYFWHIKSISKNELNTGDKVISTTFTGVNCRFDFDLEINKSASFIVDMEQKKNFIIKIKENKEANQIDQLIKYINNILNHKKIDKSFFFDEILITLKKKLKAILKDYNTLKVNPTNSFFCINNDIIQINRRIQEVFYDFILNILVILYKDFEIDPTLDTPMINRNYIDVKFSEEEKFFLKSCRATVKYNTYFDLFLKRFEASAQLKVSLLFSDEYVNLKMKDEMKNIPEHIQYFKIMDNLYSLNPKNEDIIFNVLYCEYNKVKEKTINKKYNKNKKQLFSLDQNKIKLFLYYKKNKIYFQSLKNEKFQMEIIDKMSVPITIKTYFFKILSQEYYLRCSLVYIFSMTFPLLSFQDSLYFLKIILEGLKKVKYFQRFFCYILLKSIHKFYLINEKKGQFPKFTVNNAINYCQLINAHLMQNFIPYSEEIFLFLKKIFTEKGNSDKNKNEKNNNKEIYVYQNEEKEFEKNISNQVVKKENNFIYFNYKGMAIKKASLNSTTLIFQKSESLNDDFFTCLNFDLESLFIEEILEIIVNLIFFFNLEKFKNVELSHFLTEMVVLLKNVENKLYDFRKSKETSKSDIKQNLYADDINNNNIDDINNNDIVEDKKTKKKTFLNDNI